MLDSKCSKCIFASRKEKGFYTCNYNWVHKLATFRNHNDSTRPLDFFPLTRYLLMDNPYKSRVQMFPILYDPVFISDDCEAFSAKPLLKNKGNKLQESPITNISNKIRSNLYYLYFHKNLGLNQESSSLNI